MKWRGPAALTLLLVSLLVLAVLPVVVERAASARLREISEVEDPARALATQLQLALTQEVAGVRAFLLTGDERYDVAHREARAMRTRAIARLQPLVPRLGAPIQAQVESLNAQLEAQDARLDTLFASPLSRQAYVDHLDDAQSHLEAATAAVVSLDQEISHVAASRSAQIRTLERVSAALTVFLVLVAAVAALLVARFGRRYRRLAEEAERRREELERVSESRTRLMRGFSHDVKNPLGAADGYAALLEDGVLGELSARQCESVGSIRRSIQTSLRLIADLLDVARAEAGQLEITKAPADVAAIVREVAEDFRAQAESSGQTLEVRAPESLPTSTDQARVAQVLANLLSNAIKYAPGVPVTVAALDGGHAADAPRPGEWIAVRVSDQGPGIPPEKQKWIFEEFTRLESDAKRGAGVGLAISRRLARMLGGELTVASEVGRGATFTLWLPRSPINAGGRDA